MAKKRASGAGGQRSKPVRQKKTAKPADHQAPLTPHDHAERLVETINTLDELNEADTRHRVIDAILHDVLSWPRSSVNCESYVSPGYADYVLLGRRERHVLFIEAKKNGYYFKLPPKFTKTASKRYIAVKTLLTDGDIAQAINQVRTYCLDTGCEHAAITNGRQWIIFKTFGAIRIGERSVPTSSKMLHFLRAISLRQHRCSLMQR